MHNQLIGFIDASEKRTAESLSTIILEFINSFDYLQKIMAP